MFNYEFFLSLQESTKKNVLTHFSFYFNEKKAITLYKYFYSHYTNFLSDRGPLERSKIKPAIDSQFPIPSTEL